MKVSDYIALRLAQAGIDTAFLVQGAANNNLIYSIADRKDIRYVCAMHEQAAGFMAEGYAKVRGVPGLAIGTSGPGGQNLLTPICNCFYDSVPAIFITGQVNSRFMRPSPELRQVGFQEWPAAAVFRGVTKWAATVRTPNEIRWYLEKALWICQSGRPGPVVLDIPMDVQRADVDPDAMHHFEAPANRPTQMRQGIEWFIDDLIQAKRPVVLIGGGVRGYQTIQTLNVLAECLQIPFFPTWNAIDVVPSDHPWYGGRVGTYGGDGRNFAVQNCDLLLAIGCRLSGRITGGNVKSFARAAKRYVVDVDPALLRPDLQQLPFHVNIRGDAQAFMQYLEYAVRRRITDGQSIPSFISWCNQVKEWRDRYDPVAASPATIRGIHPYWFVRYLSQKLPANAIVVYDCGGNAVIMNHAFRSKTGQRIFSNNGNSPMGFAFCAAIGAWFADPARPVICIIGDGGFNLNIQELQTMKNYGVPVKTFIMNNGIYGITHAFQETHFNGRFEASGPNGYSPPHFRSVVEAYGIRAEFLEDPNKVDYKIRDVLASSKAIVCDVISPNFCTYEPKINGWNTPIEDMYPWLPRDEFRANMLIDPLPGWENCQYK